MEKGGECTSSAGDDAATAVCAEVGAGTNDIYAVRRGGNVREGSDIDRQGTCGVFGGKFSSLLLLMLANHRRVVAGPLAGELVEQPAELAVRGVLRVGLGAALADAAQRAAEEGAGVGRRAVRLALVADVLPLELRLCVSMDANAGRCSGGLGKSERDVHGLGAGCSMCVILLDSLDRRTGIPVKTYVGGHRTMKLIHGFTLPTQTADTTRSETPPRRRDLRPPESRVLHGPSPTDVSFCFGARVPLFSGYHHNPQPDLEQLHNSICPP